MSAASLASVCSPPGAELRAAGERLTTALTGDWKLEGASPQFAVLLEAQFAVSTIRTFDFDATGLGEWDSSLLVFLLQAQDISTTRDIRFDGAGLPEAIMRLLVLARAVPARAVEAQAARATVVTRLGEGTLRAAHASLAAVTFTGEATDALIRWLLRRVRIRWREFWVVVQSSSSGALPIVTLIALLVGVIIAFLGVVVLKRFGAGYYVSYLVGYGMLREMGALMTGIIMAGRTGAAFAAELGSMKISEEIDAYRTLGLSPVDQLVLPRLLGLFVVMPLLVIYADFVGIVGGMAVAVTLLDLTPTQFVGGLLSAVTLPDALLGLFKGTIFGLIIGIAGCMKGMQTGSDAGAVGRSATAAVVLGITLIIVANAVVDWLAALLLI